MDVTAIAHLFASVGPGMGIGVLGIWFGIRKDGQCMELASQLRDIAKGVAVTNQQVVGSLDGLRDAIRQGIRS